MIGSRAGVGLPQGSVLSPFFFNIAFDVLSEAIREGPVWGMMYAVGFGG